MTTIKTGFMYTVYILYSPKHGKTYTGFTSDLLERFRSHNELGKGGWTVRYRPWLVLYIEIFLTKSEAMVREKELKSGKGRDWVKGKLNNWIHVFGGEEGSYPPRRT